MTKPTSLTVVPTLPTNDRWQRARNYVEGAALFQRASLAAQIMAGFELAELNKIYNRQGKRSDLTLSHDDTKLSWEEALKQHLGIGKMTAWRWMEMAKAAKPRLAKSDLQLGAILEKHPGALTGPEQELLRHAVHKISDGRTQMEFMLEEGIIKAPQGSGAKGGNTGGRQATNVEVLAEGQREQTRLLINLLTEALTDRPWNPADEADRRKLHGLLIDTASAVKETLR